MAANSSDTGENRGEREICTQHLRYLPQFSGKQVEKHLEGCGKSDVGCKGYKLFLENYIHDAYVQYEFEQKSVKFASIKCLCHRSQKKSEPPHILLLKTKPDNQGEAEIVSCSSPCAAEYEK